jgi:hypothetical protein
MHLNNTPVVECEQNIVAASRMGKGAEGNFIQPVPRGNLLSELAKKSCGPFCWC